MSDETGTYPYTLEALPCDKRAGQFRWVIRKHGKLIERSDKPYFSERAARKQAQAALERQFRSGKRKLNGLGLSGFRWTFWKARSSRTGRLTLPASCRV